jgi:hypothetical protein
VNFTPSSFAWFLITLLILYAIVALFFGRKK